MFTRAHFYDVLSLLMLVGSLAFFYLSTQFLVDKDYIAAGLATFIGILVVRVGMELARLTLLVRRRERERSGREADGQ